MPDSLRPDRENMEYDIVIIGAGPSGLSCAIKLKQLAAHDNRDISICILEKGSEVGAHILSGAVIDPRALNELIPDWKEKGAPLHVPVKSDEFKFLSKSKSYRLPTPPQMHNKGNYIASLGNLCRWLAAQAEALGVEIFPGFAAAEILYNDQGAVIGVATGDMGIDKQGNKTDSFEAGMEIHAKQTVFAEGCRGSLTKQIMNRFDLNKDADPQTYGLGIKEIWEVNPENHKLGHAMHTIGWPMDRRTYGGSWIYHMENNLVSIGFVVGLDYENPNLSPYEEMQRFKTHPSISPLLNGGKRIAYGARALVEGGFQSIPKLCFKGGILIGDTAGFLNVPKIKGTHTAMKSGMIAAQSLYTLFENDEITYAQTCLGYEMALHKSWIWSELKAVRNIRPGFQKGLFFGLCNAVLETITGGKLPWTLKNHADYKQLKKAADCPKIDYPKHDNILTFDRLTSVQLSNTNHEEDQPCHLKLKDHAIPITQNLPLYDEPAQRYCPAGVYEVILDENGQPQFKINAQNCVHCKTCDIKDPAQNINWCVPQGGGGPNYPNM